MNYSSAQTKPIILEDSEFYTAMEKTVTPFLESIRHCGYVDVDASGADADNRKLLCALLYTTGTYIVSASNSRRRYQPRFLRIHRKI